jgi:peptidoglycan/LPS O-acetylase OafA/YrhL
VRGIAILLVMIFHFSSYGRGLVRSSLLVDRVYYQFAGAGWIGVDLFFVLSGFLITGIFGSQLPRQLVFLVVATGASLVLALLSWKIWEERFLKAKERFPYGSGAASPDSQAVLTVS